MISKISYIYIYIEYMWPHEGKVLECFNNTFGSMTSLISESLSSKTLGRCLRRFVSLESIRGRSTNRLWIPLPVSPTIAKARRLPKAFPKIPDTMPDSQQENGPPGQSPMECRAAAAAKGGIGKDDHCPFSKVYNGECDGYPFLIIN